MELGTPPIVYPPALGYGCRAVEAQAAARAARVWSVAPVSFYVPSLQPLTVQVLTHARQRSR